MEMTKEDTDLCIVYDKTTEVQAIALYNKLSEKLIRCVKYDEKLYKTVENDSTNFNKVLYFSKDLTDKRLPHEVAKIEELCPGVFLHSIGCTYGISVDTSQVIEKNFMGRNWWKYLITLGAAGLIGAIALTISLFIKDPVKKTTRKLYFDAVQYLIKDDNISIIVPKKLDY